MRTLRVRQIDLRSHKHVALHEFPFPDYKDKGFYRSVISYSAFFDYIGYDRKTKKYIINHEQ